jgi:hypothetical protein
VARQEHFVLVDYDSANESRRLDAVGELSNLTL